MAPAKAVSEMKNRYGKVSRSISTARARLCGSSPKPGANSQISSGAASTPTRVISARVPPRVPATRSISALVAAALPSSRWRVRYSLSTGTKAWLKAPSANRRRRKLGMRNATKKASVPAEAPSSRASTTSRTSPSTRDSSVMLLTTRVEASKPPFLPAVSCSSIPAPPKNRPRVTKARRHRHRPAPGIDNPDPDRHSCASSGPANGSIRPVLIDYHHRITDLYIGAGPWLTHRKHASARVRRNSVVSTTQRCVPWCVRTSRR